MPCGAAALVPGRQAGFNAAAGAKLGPEDLSSAMQRLRVFAAGIRTHVDGHQESIVVVRFPANQCDRHPHRMAAMVSAPTTPQFGGHRRSNTLVNAQVRPADQSAAA